MKTYIMDASNLIISRHSILFHNMSPQYISMSEFRAGSFNIKSVTILLTDDTLKKSNVGLDKKARVDTIYVEGISSTAN